MYALILTTSDKTILYFQMASSAPITPPAEYPPIEKASFSGLSSEDVVAETSSFKV
jgi:hypothetical protein